MKNIQLTLILRKIAMIVCKLLYFIHFTYYVSNIDMMPLYFCFVFSETDQSVSNYSKDIDNIYNFDFLYKYK